MPGQRCEQSGSSPCVSPSCNSPVRSVLQRAETRHGIKSRRAEKNRHVACRCRLGVEVPHEQTICYEHCQRMFLPAEIIEFDKPSSEAQCYRKSKPGYGYPGGSCVEPCKRHYC